MAANAISRLFTACAMALLGFAGASTLAAQSGGSGAAAGAAPESTSLRETFDAATISNLPVNERRFDSFALLSPNVVPDGSSGLLSFRGISGLYNQNLADGTNDSQAFSSEARGRATGAAYVHSQDSIEELAISSSGYSAEFGEAAGGIIHAITKSGSNQIHGDLFYYLRYPALNALDPYSKWSALHNGGSPTLLTPTVHQQQQFGGSAGGPIRFGPIHKDTLFYFFTYDGLRKVNPILYTSSVSSSALLGYASNAATCPSPLTAAQCTAAAQFIQSGLGAFPRDVKQDVFFPKLDYRLGEKNRIGAQFLWEDFHEPNGYHSSATINGGSVTQNGTADVHERVLVARWEWKVNASAANSLRTQWSRDLETDTTNFGGPAFSLTNLFAYGATSAPPRSKLPDEHRIEAVDVYTFTHGRQVIQAGFDLNFIHDQIQSLLLGNGSYSYTGTTEAANFASWVQDVYGINGAKHYSNFSQVTDAIDTTAPGLDDFWSRNLAGFAEDSWKMTSRLTLSGGIRYDLQLVPQPPHPYTTSYNGVASPLGSYYTSTIPMQYKMIQPRIGFAYKVKPGTVVRGGYGMFYGLNSNSLYSTTRVENGVYQRQYNIASPTAANAIPAPDYFFLPPGPAPIAPFPGAATPAPASGGGNMPFSFRGIDPHFTNPYTHTFNLGIEQQLPFKSTLTVAYVGARGMRLPYSVDVNQPPPTTVRTYEILGATIAAPTGSVTVPFTPANTLRPSPNDGNILVAFSGINSWYHSGVATIRRPFANGLELLANYTWAKALDESAVAGGNSVQNPGGGTFQGTNVILDPFNIRGRYGNGVNMYGEYGRSDLDIRGRWVASAIYAPKFKTRFPKPVWYLINGWQVSATYIAQSGTPLTSLMSGTIPTPGSSSFPTAIDYTGLDGGATGEAVTLNNSAGAGRVPFLPRNNTVYAGFHTMDARLGHTFPMHGPARFEIFVEAFNLSNHTEVQGVQASAYQYVQPGTTAPMLPNSALLPPTCPATNAAPCIAPYQSASAPFGTPTSTSGNLYGARQVQFGARFSF